MYVCAAGTQKEISVTHNVYMFVIETSLQKFDDWKQHATTFLTITYLVISKANERNLQRLMEWYSYGPTVFSDPQPACCKATDVILTTLYR